jgi:cytochrome c oxidase assembly protein subunit 15
MMRRNLIWTAAALAFVVIMVGAYVRLEDAGLGCPDWPGCYGRWVGVPQTASERARAEQAFPGRPVDTGRAQKEMLHRYLAGALGLLVFAIAVIAWRRRGELRQTPIPAYALVALVVFQAALGMWTVTLLLKPAIVTLHLLGGMATFALLIWLALRETDPGHPAASSRHLGPWAAASLAALVCQIALGGWVSSNYAGLACPDFPTCNGTWLPAMDFEHAFTARRELGMTAAGAPLPYEALVAIHWCHRVGAVATAVLVGGLAIAFARVPGYAAAALLLIALLGGQIVLGIANVVARLPLALAVAHNAGAALLLAALVVINFTVFRRIR